MRRACPTCGSEIPDGTRAEFCPVCVLREAREPEDETETIGDYELLEVIGRGGMGVVWRARQQSLNRTVAVKVILGGDFASQASRDRFRVEAQAAARLRHPNIVTIYEIGEHEGLPFFSMELVEGDTLAELARGEPMQARAAAEILCTVAGAVQHAHENGVLHRDLKPANILVDGTGAPRVTDFGLAKLADQDLQLTLTAQAIGSPAYMPPEQARREPGTPASDVYALGAVLYHLLTGRPPFQGESIATLLGQVESAEPVPPRRLNPSVPADLENITLKCLEKQPSRRYGTARELAEDLGRYLRGEEVHARPVGPIGVWWRWSRRHPALAGLWLALAALAVILTVSVISVQRANIRGEASLRESLLSEARATRLAGLPGHRARALDRVARAAALGPTHAELPVLRSEVIASLSRMDARFDAAATLPSIPDMTRVAFDAEHRLCAHGNPEGPVIITRIQDGAELHRIDCGQRRLWNITAFSNDGRFLLLRHPRSISVVEVATGALCVEAPAGINQAAFSADSKSIVVAQRDNHLVFGLPAGNETQRWAGAATAVACSASADLAACAIGQQIEVRELSSGKLRRAFPAPPDVAALAWSFDGEWIAAGTQSGEITLLNAEMGARLRRLDGHQGPIRCIAFDRGRALLGSASDDGTTRLWELGSERPPLTVSLQSFGFSFNTAGNQLGPVWAFGPTGVLAILRPEGYTTLRPEPSSSYRPGVDWSRDGRWLAAAGADGVHVWNRETWQMLKPVETMIDSVAFDPQGDILALGTSKGARRYALPAATSGELRLLEERFPARGTPGVAYARHKNQFATARDSAGQIDIFEDGSAEPARSIKHGTQLSSVALSSDGSWLAATSDWGADSVRVWNTITGVEAAHFGAPGAHRTAFSPDGKWLAAFGTAPQLWRTDTWKPAFQLGDGMRNEFAGAGAFSADGKFIAVLLGAGVPHLFVLDGDTTPRLIMSLESQVAPRIGALAFSPDGARLAGAGPRGQVEVWDLDFLRATLRERGNGWGLPQR